MHANHKIKQLVIIYRFTASRYRDSDTKSADYKTVKDHYMHMHTEPVQEYYVKSEAANEGAVIQDKKSERVQYPVQKKVVYMHSSSVDSANYYASRKLLCAGFIHWGYP